MKKKKKKKEKSKLGPTRNKIKTEQKKNKKQKYGKHTQEYRRQDQNKSVIFF
jgi:hypothetical protein